MYATKIVEHTKKGGSIVESDLQTPRPPFPIVPPFFNFIFTIENDIIKLF